MEWHHYHPNFCNIFRVFSMKLRRWRCCCVFFNSHLGRLWFKSMDVDKIENCDYYKYIHGFSFYIWFFSSLVRHKANMPFTDTLFRQNFIFSWAYPWFCFGFWDRSCPWMIRSIWRMCRVWLFKIRNGELWTCICHINIVLQSSFLLPTSKMPHMCQKNP